MKVYYDKDADRDLIKKKKIAIVGYGSQGHAHALNLRDSGVADLVVALRTGSPSEPKAKAEGFKIMELSEAAEWADIVMFLTPDELQRTIYKNTFEQRLKKGTAIAFAHGLNIHFKLINPREDLDVFMVAPKGPGHLVRAEYKKGAGVPCLMAIFKDSSLMLFESCRRNLIKTSSSSIPIGLFKNCKAVATSRLSLLLIRDLSTPVASSL